jgi:hypothetical protein
MISMQSEKLTEMCSRQYEATATVTVPSFSCQNDTFENGKNVTCELSATIPLIKASMMMPVEKPHKIAPQPETSAVSPSGNDDLCLGMSFTYPEWEIRDLVYKLGGEQTCNVSFTLQHRPTGQVSLCKQHKSGLERTDWVACSGGQANFFVDDENGQLRLMQQWSCSPPPKA